MMRRPVSGVAGAAMTCSPGSTFSAYVRSRLRLQHPPVVGCEVRDRQARLDVQVGRHLAEVDVEVDGGDLLGRLSGECHRDVDRDRRGSDAALGAEAGDEAPPAGDPNLAAGLGREVTGAREPDEESLDAGLELAGVEGAGDDIVGAGLEEADALLHVVLLGHAQDRNRRQGGRTPDLPADLGGAARGLDGIDRDEVELTGSPDRLVGVGDRGDLVACRAQRGDHRLGGFGDRREEKDRRGRHDAVRPPMPCSERGEGYTRRRPVACVSARGMSMNVAAGRPGGSPAAPCYARAGPFCSARGRAGFRPR